MNRSIIEEELKRREENDENAYNMIGTELKRVRTSQSQTLSSIAGDICSVSYLCKIEQARMKPNKYVLGEICKKLKLDEPKMSILFDLKKIIYQMLESFYKKDTKKLFDIYEQCQNLDNYRSKMIKLIYYLYNFEMDLADITCKELLNLTNVMMKDELAIFVTFYAILNYYQEFYIEALENLTFIENQSNDENVIYIAKNYIFYCYFKMNLPLTLVYGQELADFYLKQSEFKRADYIRYLLCLYKLNNKMSDMALKDSELLQNMNYRKSMEFFYDCQKKQLKEANYYDYLRPFARIIHTYVFHKEGYYNIFLKLEKAHMLECDFIYNIANYLILNDDKERYNAINGVIIPNLVQSQNRVEMEFFLNELCQLSGKLGRYKCLKNVLSSLIGGK